MASTVTYEFYVDTFGGGLSEAAFGASVGMAESHVRWLCELRDFDETCDRFKRAVCAACEAFAEYGAGEVGGYTIGQFSVKNYENKGTTGEELATQAALRELGLSGLAFTGVC